jgi:hypothetical protein
LRKSVPSPSHDAKPNTSVSVVMNTDEASAGSTFIARSASGISVPAVAATNMLMIIAAHRMRRARGPLPRPDDERADDAAGHAVADARPALP